MRSLVKDLTRQLVVAGQWVSTGASGYFSREMNVSMYKSAVGVHEMTFHDLKVVNSITANVSGGLQGYAVTNISGGNKVIVYTYRFTGEAQDWHFTFEAEGIAK